jgi:hypothetical protein
MKKTIVFMVVMIFCLASAGMALAQMHEQGQMGQMHEQGQMEQMPQAGNMGQMHPTDRDDDYFCPWCGRRGGMGMGMMNGQGMMHRGWGMHHGWSRGHSPRHNARQMAPLAEDEAKMLMRNYVSANPNLKIGNIKQEGDTYVGEVVTQDGSLVEKLVVDKWTGWMKRTY